MPKPILADTWGVNHRALAEVCTIKRQKAAGRGGMLPKLRKRGYHVD